MLILKEIALDLETAFTIVNLAVLPAWISLFAAPGWKWTQTVAALVTPGVMAAVYLLIIAIGLTRPSQGDPASLMTLSGVQALFQDPLTVLGGWVHYLAFDLVTGSWEVRDARRLRISHLLVVPCLFFTLMLGPFGLLCYLLLRSAMRRTPWVDGPPGGATDDPAAPIGT